MLVWANPFLSVDGDRTFDGPALGLHLAPRGQVRSQYLMNTAELIGQIERLTPVERAEVARALNRKLTADELEALARRMVEAADADEARALEDEWVRGFYGGKQQMPDGIELD